MLKDRRPKLKSERNQDYQGQVYAEELEFFQLVLGDGLLRYLVEDVRGFARLFHHFERVFELRW